MQVVAMNHTPPLLQIESLSRSFTLRRGILGTTRHTLHAVDSVSATLHKGETLGLVGESGCGKSTLGRMIVGLLAPSSGDICIQGQSVVSPDSKQRMTGRVQMIFQDPFSSLNPRLSVGASIAEPLLAGTHSRQKRQALTAEMLAMVGLSPEHAQRYPHEFSGGQRQRIAIARALVTRPALVVCDEAVSALDASVQAQVLNLLKDMRDHFDLSYVFISHNLSVVGIMSDRVAVMYLGRMVETAPTDTLFDRAAHPYTQALLAAAPSLKPGQRTQRSLTRGELPSPLAPPPGCHFHPRCPKVMDICRLLAPAQTLLAPGHTVMCHLYGEKGRTEPETRLALTAQSG